MRASFVQTTSLALHPSKRKRHPNIGGGERKGKVVSSSFL
ncbi:hypothetical protein PC116_g14990 [Phytophthora cactorum]|nr:hypothetical protein PC120_g9897 [Phytophthora cactorum]KAG4042262.1 hypothetical protein PC123_g22242 [Phytophthora cactorum]KAG4236933.1 hypothetical protein PC116_g14990 [Phytophthora cactorum]